MAVNGKTVSVLVTTYHPKRRRDAAGICAMWSKEPVEQVWLLDGSGQSLPVAPIGFMHWKMPVDFGTRTDYGVALLAEGDLIICADDDLMPKPGFVQDLVDGMDALDAGFVGVIGRIFNDPEYSKTTYYAASKIEKPQRVDFCGICYMAKREYFGFDTRGMPRNCDDLWHARQYPDVPKYVIPTQKYENLKTHNDGTAMFKMPELKAQRQEYYEDNWRMMRNTRELQTRGAEAFKQEHTYLRDMASA